MLRALILTLLVTLASAAGQPQAAFAQSDGVAEIEATPTDAAVPDAGGLAAAGELEGGEAPSFFEQFFGNPLNLVLICGILFILLVLRPQQKQMKEMQNALSGLKKNDRVITGSGIHGTVVQANPDEPLVTIRIDENTGARMTINRDAITKIVGDETKK